MLEPVSVGAVVCTMAFAFSRPQTGYSDESRIVKQSGEVARKRLESSHALFGKKSAVIATINSLLEECSNPGWDGDDADPIDPSVGDWAEDLVRALPEDYPMPEISPEATGTLSLDWINSRHRFLSLTVTSTGRLLYVSVYGANRSRGVVGFDGRHFPTQVIDALGLVFGEKNASIGIA